MKHRRVSLCRSSRRVPTNRKILLREIGWQTTFYFGKVTRARYARVRIFLPTVWIIKREVDVVFGELAIKILLRVYELYGIGRGRIGWRRVLCLTNIEGCRLWRWSQCDRRLRPRLPPGGDGLLVQPRLNNKKIVRRANHANPKHKQHTQNPEHQRKF